MHSVDAQYIHCLIVFIKMRSQSVMLTVCSRGIQDFPGGGGANLLFGIIEMKKKLNGGGMSLAPLDPPLDYHYFWCQPKFIRTVTEAIASSEQHAFETCTVFQHLARYFQLYFTHLCTRLRL